MNRNLCVNQRIHSFLDLLKILVIEGVQICVQLRFGVHAARRHRLRLLGETACSLTTHNLWLLVLLSSLAAPSPLGSLLLRSHSSLLGKGLGLGSLQIGRRLRADHHCDVLQDGAQILAGEVLLHAHLLCEYLH